MSEKPTSYVPLALPDRHDFSDAEMLSRAVEFQQYMAKRHSTREFSDREVSREIIEACVKAAGTAPSGANQQPWHFVAVSNADVKSRIRKAAEAEEEKFYEGGAGDAWLRALEPIGTHSNKPHLEIAPWLIVIFAERWGTGEGGERQKRYYVPESVGISVGMLITALHNAGLSALVHTPNPMAFLNDIFSRPFSEKPIMIITVGHAAIDATVPAAAKIKKPLDEILTVFD